MPKLVCSRLEMIQRDFLWGGGNLERKPHLVNWKTVCLEKSRGGLGVRSLSKMNKVLLCKWCWRFTNERDPLWRLVISTKFNVLKTGPVIEPEKLPVHSSLVQPVVGPRLKR